MRPWQVIMHTADQTSGAVVAINMYRLSDGSGWVHDYNPYMPNAMSVVNHERAREARQKAQDEEREAARERERAAAAPPRGGADGGGGGAGPRGKSNLPAWMQK